MEAYIELPIILRELARLLTLRKTGTFFIATDGNAACQLAMEQGRITYCAFSRLHGQAAINALLQISAGRYSFSTSPFPFRTTDKVAHDTVAALLGIGVQLQAPQPDKVQADIALEDAATLPVTKTHIYRGQIVEVTAGAEPGKTEEPAATAPLRKKARYYRGQLIRD